MKNWIYIVYIGLIGCLVSSCQQSLDEEVQVPTTGRAHIIFTISLDDINSRSRAENWNSNENATDAVIGNDKENQINLASANGLQVLVYSKDGALLGEVTNKEVRRVSTNEYEFNGELVINSLTSENLECRLMVYANCEQSKDIYSYDVEYIPMWGVKETTLTLAKGEQTRVPEPIYLLRTMAKVEVKLAAEISTDNDMTAVMIDRYNAQGKVHPTDYAAVASTELMDQQTVFNPDTTSIGTNLYFEKATDNSFYIYLPEYQNVGEKVKPAIMKLTINNVEYDLEFKMYNDNSPFNLIRNHYYQYTIVGMPNPEVLDDVKLVYRVVDYYNDYKIGVEFN